MSRLSRDRELSFSRMAARRSALYAFFGRCFVAEPGPELVAMVRDKEAGAVLASMGLDVAALAGMQEPNAHESLLLEYTRMYLGPGEHIPPYESAFTGANSPYRHGFGEMQGQCYQAVVEAYREGGMVVSEAYADIQDQLGIELEFLRLLTFRESQAWRKRRDAEAVELRGKQMAFISEHPGRWIGEFAELSKKQARMPFYPTMAGMTRDFLASESEFLKEPRR